MNGWLAGWLGFDHFVSWPNCRMAGVKTFQISLWCLWVGVGVCVIYKKIFLLPNNGFDFVSMAHISNDSKRISSRDVYCIMCVCVCVTS